MLNHQNKGAQTFLVLESPHKTIQFSFQGLESSHALNCRENKNKGAQTFKAPNFRLF
jgi:hypothetical protein